MPSTPIPGQTGGVDSVGTPRPNIVWISTHDINPHLGCYAGVWPGAEHAITPNLDRLAAEGVRFDHAFASAPVCAPSRASMLTGCHPSAIGTLHMRTKAVPPPQVRLLPEYFREAGYWTTCTDFTDFQVQVPATTFDEHGADADWRSRPTAETPFFAQFHGLITHESQIYLAEEEYAHATRHLNARQRQDPQDLPLPPYYPDTPVFRRYWARIFELITAMDHWVGGILDRLAEDDLVQDTIVVFWSEHGPGYPRAKRWVHEAGVREPLIIRWPGRIEAGSVRTDVVPMMDLAPTMLTMCGLTVPGHMHAEAVYDAEGTPITPHEYAFSARGRMGDQFDRSFSIRDQRYRFIRNDHPDRSELQYLHYGDGTACWQEFRRLGSIEAGQLGLGHRPDALTPLQRTVIAPSKPAEELYDLVEDPHETTNLVGEAGHSEVLHRLRAALDAWVEKYGATAMMDEQELLEQWRPGGRTQVTKTPVLTVAEGIATADCATEGAGIAWTTDPPTPCPGRTPMQDMIGLPVDDGRYWHLYTGPFQVPPDGCWLRAERLGFDPSEEVRVPASC
ncbi:MAG: sulfatase [Actinomycetales bacterium]